MDWHNSIFLLLILIINSCLPVYSSDKICNIDSDCLNFGKCLLLPEPFTGKMKKQCQCADDFAGETCQLRKCPENPCLNSGICEWTDPIFKCHCPLGYSGSLCDTPIPNACDIKGCVNGLCRLEGSTDNAVCDCLYGFGGDRCESTTLCDPVSCSGHGTCSSNGTSVSCLCDAGWKGERCEIDVDECVADPEICGINGECINSPGTYFCRCKPGFIGVHCEKSHSESCSPQPCQNGGTCSTGYLQNSFTCKCPPGFTGALCEEKNNECAPIEDTNIGDLVSRCTNGGSCIDDINEFQCICAHGFTGHDCRQNIDECSLYGSSLCLNGGTCMDTYGSYKCACVIGFTGDRCEIDIDDCVNNLCYKGSKCIDKLRSYECECPENRFGIYCEFDNPCAKKNNKCLHGQCLPNSSNGNFTCLCDRGFTGEFCDIDIDECTAAARSPCYKGKCINTHGSYKCECEIGYEGENCDISIDECENRPCFNGATCLDLAGDFQCICMPSWSGKRCEIPKPYSPGCEKHMCMHGGVCRKTPFSEEYCHCPARFSGRSCDIVKSDPCADNKCKNSGKCIATNDYNSYSCECQKGFSGHYCEKKSQSCKENPCLVGECIDTLNGFQCQCPPGYRGDNCEININECKPGLCKNGGICVDEVNGYSCSCPATHTGERCEINVTDPCQKDPCLNDGTCMTLSVNGRFTCNCKDGFDGFLCQINTNICDPSRCLNGGYCTIEQKSCNCPENFNGTFCERNQNTCANVQCQNDGICENFDNDFFCNCGYGFAGRFCEKKVNIDKYEPEEKKEKDSCEKSECSKLAGNGICDPDCNYPGCDYDGGDCSASIFNPFSNCTYANYCKYVFRDNHCDEICNNEGCLFDGFDCEEKVATKCPDEENCLKEYANGICNPECNSAACGWDGGDCTTKHDVLSDNLVLTLITDPKNFVEKIAPKLLMIVSQLLRVSSRYQLDKDGFPMIYEWSSISGQGSLIMMETTQATAIREKREDDELKGVIIYLHLDASVCKELSSLTTLLHVETIAVNGNQDCFTDAKLAANMIAADTNQNAFTDLGISVYDARVQPRKTSETSSNYFIYIIICTLGGVVFIVAMLNSGTQRALKRKLVTIRGVFYPPTSNEIRSQQINHPQQKPPYGLNNYNLDRQSLMSETGSFNGPMAKKFREEPIETERVFTKLHEYASSAEPITQEQIENPTIQLCACVRDLNERTCIHWAVESLAAKKDRDIIEDIKKLVSIGCPLNAQDDTGATALHLAIRSNRKDVAIFLLDKIDVNIPDDDGRTALFDAVATKSFDIFEKILRLEGVDVNTLANTNDTPLIKCCRLGDEMLPFVELLLKHPKILVDKTAEKSTQNSNGKSAMHEAAACNSIQIMKLLAKKGVSISGHDCYQHTPLFMAVKSNQFEAVKYLLINKADPNAPNDCDETPLSEAKRRGFKEIENLLLSAGAQPSPCPTVPGGSYQPPYPSYTVPLNEVKAAIPSFQSVQNIEKSSANNKSVRKIKGKGNTPASANSANAPNHLLQIQHQQHQHAQATLMQNQMNSFYDYSPYAQQYQMQMPQYHNHSMPHQQNQQFKIPHSIPPSPMAQMQAAYNQQQQHQFQQQQINAQVPTCQNRKRQLQQLQLQPRQRDSQQQQQQRQQPYQPQPQQPPLPQTSNYSSSPPSTQIPQYPLINSESPHISDSAYGSPSPNSYHNSSTSTNTSGHSDTSSFASPPGSHDQGFWPNTSPDAVTVIGSNSTLVAPNQPSYAQEQPIKSEYAVNPNHYFAPDLNMPYVMSQATWGAQAAYYQNNYQPNYPYRHSQVIPHPPILPSTSAPSNQHHMQRSASMAEISYHHHP